MFNILISKFNAENSSNPIIITAYWYDIVYLVISNYIYHIFINSSVIYSIDRTHPYALHNSYILSNHFTNKLFACEK